MAALLLDRKPYIRYPSGSIDEIMFTARNVNMASGGNTVQQEIEDMKVQIDLLTEFIETLRAENTALKTALETQMNTLRESISSSYITREKIIEALGFEPCEKSNWEVFQGARQPTDTTPAVEGRQGLVPSPAMSDSNSFLCGDGTWKQINTDQFLTKAEADIKYLEKGEKALKAWYADVAEIAYNVPYTARGNIWIKDN